MSIIFGFFLFISLFITNTKNAFGYAIECDPPGSDSGCYDAYHKGTCSSSYRIIQGTYCANGCRGGECVTISNSIQTDYASYCSFGGQTASCGSCFTGTNFRSLKCLCIGSYSYVVRTNTCCANYYGSSYVESRTTYGCERGCRSAADNSFTAPGGSAGYSACFSTSPSNCDVGVSSTGAANDTSNSSAIGSSSQCDFNSYSSCYCNPGWAKVGTGCHATSGLTCASGWSTSKPSGSYQYTRIACMPCGNTGEDCYKATSSLSGDCYTNSDCGCLTCINPGTPSSYCGSPDRCSGSCTTSSSCSSIGGTCGDPARSGTVHTGLCPGGSDCVCVVPNPPACTTSGSCAAIGGTCGDPSRPGTIHTGLCPGGSDCVCVVPCSPDCSASGSYCPSQTFADGCGGTCTGTKGVVQNVVGSCGTAQGQRLSTTPSGAPLCSVGSASAVSSTATTFSWTCTGTNGTCVAAADVSADCSAIRDTAPTLLNFYIRDADNGNVAGEIVGVGDSKNHICQSDFTTSSNPDMVRFVVVYTDIQGGTDISEVQLGLDNGAGYNKTYSDTALSVVGNSASAIFDVPRSDISSTSLLNIYVRGFDVHPSVTTSAVDTGRDFKFWNCQVSASGAGYDGSATGAVCADVRSFNQKISSTKTYDLTMNDAASGSPTDDRIMTVNSPDYTSGAATLTWGKQYIFDVTNLAGNTSSLSLRLNGNSCPGSKQFTINNTVANPYSASVSFTADFTAVLDQDPWWQTKNGGALSNLSIDDQVPVTCTLPSCKISDGALVASPVIDNNLGKTLDQAQIYHYQSPNALLANVNQNYTYFFDQYFVKNNIGTTLVGDKTMSEIKALSPTGIYFINGNLAIDTDNSLTGNQFLMIIVKGNINIANTVNQVNGIFVADNMAAAGTSATKLTIKGSLFAANEISFSRGYITKVTNNTTPAVVVEHNPQLIFNLPGKLAKVLTNWQWGN